MPSCFNQTKITSSQAVETTSSELHGQYRYLCSQTICPSKLPVCLRECHTITNIGYNTVMLVGEYAKSSTANPVFKSELTSNRKDVTWEKLQYLREALYYHITFKMNDSLYVYGGFNKRLDFDVDML